MHPNGMSENKAPSLNEIKQARRMLGDKVRRTPVWEWKSHVKDELLGADTHPFMKLELLQYGGSFKCRGTLIHMLELTEEQRQRGVTAVSAGNHAISVAYAARTLGASAKVVMPQSANAAKVKRCEALGAEVLLVKNVHVAFEKVKEIEAEEGRHFIHPFEGPLTALGTATVGLELCEQAGELDAVIVPVGGGGLIAGIASCVKQMNPDIRVYGVEPKGADTMSRSLAAGRPEAIDRVDTIADSLGAPHAAPYSFGLTRNYVDRVVRVSDTEMASTMELLFTELKLAVEPAGASAAAALRCRLSRELKGCRVGLIVCGTNIDLDTYYRNITDYAHG